jgi:arylsulfatase A-like enzyme
VYEAKPGREASIVPENNGEKQKDFYDRNLHQSKAGASRSCCVIFDDGKNFWDEPVYLLANPTSMRLLNFAFVTVPAVMLIGSAGAELHAESEKPNIVFILADDMGYHDAGYMGCTEIKTPNLDRLAHSGTTLSSLYVQPVCSPTRATLLTGRYVSHTGVYEIVKPHAKWGLPLGERTIAQALREAGYETAICGKWHLGEFQPGYLPMHRGFEHQYGLWFGALDYFTHMRGKDLDWHRDDKPCDDKGYTTHLITREACHIIETSEAAKPLFLYVPYNAVHAPLEVPESYTVPYAGLPKKRKQYAGMVAAMDEGVGQILEALNKKGHTKNTLVVFGSDNGGPEPGVVTDNTPLRAGKGTIFEGGVRSYGIASWPGHIPVGTSDEPVHTVDWFPTLVKLGGGSLDSKLPLDGTDIWPVLAQGAKSPHDALLLCGLNREHRALRMGDWKLVINGANKSPELYNLKTDISEKHDVAAEHADQVATMRTKLDAMMKTAVPEPVPSHGGGGEGEGNND